MGTPKSSILIGFSIINHPFWGTTIFGNTHKDFYVASFGKNHPTGSRDSLQLPQLEIHLEVFKLASRIFMKINRSGFTSKLAKACSVARHLNARNPIAWDW